MIAKIFTESPVTRVERLNIAFDQGGETMVNMPQMMTSFSRRRRVFAHRLHAFAALAAIATGALVSVLVPNANASGAQFYGSPATHHLKQPIVTMMSTPSGRGYWLAAADGGIFSYGDARFHGSTGAMRLNSPIVGMTTTRSGNGYWLVASDGGVFAFGDAHFYGSTGNMRLNQPVVGMSRTNSGHGYWLVARDGGVFSFGDAHFYGSTGNLRLNQPIVGMATSGSSRGYWMVASDGGIFSFGDAHFYGSTAGHALSAAITSMTAEPHGKGYWIAAQDGSVYAFGAAAYAKPFAHAASIWTVVSMSAPPNGGYWFVTADGRVYALSAEGQFIADPTTPQSKQQTIAADLMSRVNTERAARGLRALTFDPLLSNFAQYWAANMGAQNSMYHSDLSALFRNPTYGNRYRALRENIYQGWGSWVTAGAAHSSLMNSDPHRATILMPELTSIGTGAACINGQLWVAEEFGLWINNPLPPGPSVPPVNPIAVPDHGGPGC